MRGMFAVILLDLKRIQVERIRLIASIIQPLLYLFVLGSGLGATSAFGRAGYMRYIFPGVITLSLLFSAFFAAMQIVFDRQTGFLKAILIAPTSRFSIALGKVVSGAMLALVPGSILLLFIPILQISLNVVHCAMLVGTMILAALMFSALGVALAARFTSTTVFPIVSNAFLLPMFFLSGALFPLDKAPQWLQALAHLDPVAYAVALMRNSLLPVATFPPLVSLAVVLTCIFLFTALAAQVFMSGEDA